ncbi:MAG: hypothetical protein J6J11_09215 [Treponema sp.]|nr:hypothetical protein [Clostridia bacterium]MBP3608478.1 hypothetical protein [Treponema sp.]
MVKCPFCYPLGTSSSEQELIDFCHQFFNDLKTHDRTLIKPYELDIVIPEIKLALEFNGIWYHSIEAGTPPGYHLMKTEMCEAKDYRLIHVWEDEWINNKELIKEKLKCIFENKEEIDNKIILLDRCWYSLKDFDSVEEVLPPLIEDRGYHVENCGYFKIKKK